MMETITISPKYFKKERNNYSSWPIAFWRELIQNSIDAGSRTIEIDIKGSGEQVKFNDNGCGMSREVLENVYFCLGETTKNTGDTIGGYGKARILTNFSHLGYKMASHDWRAEGVGSQYQIFSTKDFVKGCHIEIDTDIDPSDNLVDSLYNYLHLCQLPCKIKSNVEYINGFNDWLYRRTESRRLSFGSVHVNKSGRYSGNLIVRVNGAMMFTRSLICPYQIILEIDMERSRDVLLSNRDSLHYQYQEELDQFIQGISVDKKSLESTYNQIEIIGSGSYTSKKKRSTSSVYNVKYTTIENKEDVLVDPATSSGPDRMVAAFTQDESIVSDSLVKEDESIVPDFGNKSNFERRYGKETKTSYDSIVEDFPRVTIYKDCCTTEMKLAAYRYNPVNWRKNQGRDILNLLKQWTIACSYGVDALLESHRDCDELSWATGFIFSEKNGAFHHFDGEVHSLLLRPVDLNGKKRFGLRDYASRMHLISLAVHEVAHIVCGYHDEDFANLQTTLGTKVFGQTKNIHREMSEILVREKAY